MARISLKTLLGGIRLGSYKTAQPWDLSLYGKLEEVACSFGTGEKNGSLLRHKETGELYAAVEREAILLYA